METELETPPENTPLLGRLFNVYAAPGELFEELGQSKPTHLNWVVPLVLGILVSAIFSVVVFSQPDIVSRMFEQQDAAIDARVDSGEISQAQADQARAATAAVRSPKVLMAFGVGGAAFGGGLILLIVSALMWLLTAWILKGRIGFFKAVEMVGLAGMVNVLGGVLTLLLVLLKGSMTAAPNLAVFIGEFDPANQLHQMLSAINVVTIWYLIILSIGASKLSGRALTTAVLWVFGFWVVVRFPLAFLSAALSGIQ